MTNNLHTIRSYVYRAGRMTSRQQKALQHGQHLMLDPLCDYDWVDVFKREALRIVEIGFGMGHSLLSMAKSCPHVDFIGVEVYPPGVGQLLADVMDANLQNVRIYSADIVPILHSGKLQDLAQIQVFFPDPWHKKRTSQKTLD